MASSSESFTSPWLLGAMDSLWFHRAVLFSEPSCSNKSPVEVASSNSSSSSYSSSSATTDCSDYDAAEELYHGAYGSLPTISTTNVQDDSEGEDGKRESHEEDENNKQPTPTSTPTRRRRIKPMPRLERTLSCKTVAELEQEEVKGFMDLGFIFDKDRLTPTMVRVIPGLQRLKGQDENDNDIDENDYEEEEEEEEEEVVMEARKMPYLSEAWMVKRPDSPLLRLRMSRVSTTSSDMKRHLKLWAKTVANSAIKQS